MEENEVLQLIQRAVQPLREKIQALTKENEQIKAQLVTILHSSHQQPRQRSSAKDQKNHPRREESKQAKEGRVPSAKKIDQRPGWGVSKGQNVQHKSPPPSDKYRHIAAKVQIPRVSSKDKQVMQGQKQPPKIMGGSKTPKKNESEQNHQAQVGKSSQTASLTQSQKD